MNFIKIINTSKSKLEWAKKIYCVLATRGTNKLSKTAIKKQLEILLGVEVLSYNVCKDHKYFRLKYYTKVARPVSWLEEE